MRTTPTPGSDELRALFPGTARRTYVDTASYGLPPRATIAALEQALAAWSGGDADWRADWDPAGDECRALFARLVHADETRVALMPAVSVGVGLVAAGLRAGDEVLVPDDEFRSVLFPLLAASAAWGASITRVPFERLADAIGPRTTLVATSHVRSNGGGVQDLEAVGAAAGRHGAHVLVDATHSVGVLDVDVAETGVPGDPFLGLFAGDGTTRLAFNDNQDALDSRLDHSIATTGTYYAAVSTVADPGGNPFPYALHARVIPQANDKEMKVSNAEFMGAVDRVSTIASERGRAVKLNIGPDKLVLSVNNPEGGSATEEIGIAYGASPLEIGFNARYLLDIAGQLEGEEARFMLADPGSPTMVKDAGDESALYVLMPMRV